MLSEREVSAAVGSTAYGADGDKLGRVEHFFVDDQTGQPTWVSVTTGLFGTRHSIVPAADATFDDGSLRLPVTADAVKTAPHLAGDHLDPAEEADLRRHYGLTGTGPTGTDTTATNPPATDLTGTGDADDGPAAREPGWLPPVPPPATDRQDRAESDDAAMAPPTQEMKAVPPPPPAEEEHGPEQTDGGMTRSEERLVVGTERVATTRARIVKYVVTEEVQITVPIRREEIRVEEVPLDAPDPEPGESLVGADRPAAVDHPDGLPDEIILHTERPVVSVEVVPVERVRLRVETVEGQEQVSGQVQRERIVVEETPAPGISPR